MLFIIIMIALKKINLKILNQISNNYESRLELESKGLNYVIINTIRRESMTSVPVYAFDTITISKNDSIYHNNYLKLRIQNLAVCGIKSPHKILPDNINDDDTEDINDNNTNLDNSIEIDNQIKINKSSLKQLSMYVDYKNDTKNIVTVTTDDCNFYKDQKKIKSPFKNPIQIVKLHPDRSINLTAITKLNIEEKSAIYSPVSIFSYKELDEFHYNIYIESRGQYTEQEIISIACVNIIKKLDDILKLFLKQNEYKTEGEIHIENNGYTIGNLLQYSFNLHKNIQYAAVYKKHPLDDNIIIRYKMKKDDMIGIIKDVHKSLVDVFNLIINKLK